MQSSLVDLARETSSEKRRELMQEVSNLFVDGADRHTDREILRFGEVLSLLLDQVPVDDRASLSGRVAHLERTPRDLALKLAHDEAEVAAPILTHSRALTDDDLAHLAQHKSQDHLVAIAQRQFLTPTVTDVLVDRGNAHVLTTVTRNPGAEISDKGFGVLAVKARENKDLGEALSYRADMPPDIAEQIIASLDDAARERLQALLSGDQEMIGKLMMTARREMDTQRTDSRRSRLETKVMVQDVRQGKATASQVLDALVFKKRMLDIAFVLSELAQVPEAHVSNVLHKVNAMGIAVVCRSLEVTEPVYGRLSRLRCERLRLNTAQAEAMIRDYAELDKASADRTLRFHKVRSSVQVKAS
jgi:uncharacterized protein (DUF2336 family)